MVNKIKSGFCCIGLCEGTKPKSSSGKPMRICDIPDCPCKCHAQITEMFKMVGKERPAPQQNPEYLEMIDQQQMAATAMLETVRRMTAVARSDVSLVVPDPDAPDDVKIEPVIRPQEFTPTGRRVRGSLEHEVLQVCIRFADKEWEDDILCTPKFVSEEIGKIHTSEPPSTGAISAVWARWEKLGFSTVLAKPARFGEFKNPNPELGHSLELDRLKTAAKRVKKKSMAATKRGDGLLARAKDKKNAQKRR